MLHRIAEGLTNREIADRLYLSLYTVKAHACSIFAKAVLYLAVPLSAMLGSELEILYGPLLVQELVMAAWLIVKGFNRAARAPEPA